MTDKVALRKAIAHRGWCPLTYNLLNHPSIKDQNSKIINEPTIIREINTSTGYVSEVMESIIEHRIVTNRKNSKKIAMKKLKTAKETLKQCKKITAGLLFASGSTYLGQDVLKHVEKKRKEKEDKLIRAKDKKLAEEKELKDAVFKIIIRKGKDPNNMICKELKKILKLLKIEGEDDTIPTTRELLIKRFYEWRERFEILCTDIPTPP